MRRSGDGWYYGLRVVDTRLHFGQDHHSTARGTVAHHEMVFEPEGARLLGSDAPGRFGWDEFVGVNEAGSGRWWLNTGQRVAAMICQVAGDQNPASGQDNRWPIGEDVESMQSRTLDPVGARTAAALCAYVAATTEARVGLNDTSRLDALIAELVRVDLGKRRRGPGLPATGDHREAVEALRAAVWPLLPPQFGGRFVTGDVMPSLDSLVATAIASIPDHVAERWRTVEFVAQEIGKFFQNQPWPFGVLADGETHAPAPLFADSHG